MHAETVCVNTPLNICLIYRSMLKKQVFEDLHLAGCWVYCIVVQSKVTIFWLSFDWPPTITVKVAVALKKFNIFKNRYVDILIELFIKNYFLRSGKKRIDFDQLLLENNKIFWIHVKIHILDHFKHFNYFFIKIFIIVNTFEEN